MGKWIERVLTALIVAFFAWQSYLVVVLGYDMRVIIGYAVVSAAMVLVLVLHETGWARGKR